MIALSFELCLKEPLLATALEGDPNSAVSLPFIPGSMLRGALIGRYLARCGTSDLAADPQPRVLRDDGERTRPGRADLPLPNPRRASRAHGYTSSGA